jgi:replicative DNA helicase
MTQAQPLPPILPENRDAEQALLGALMINNKLFDQIAGICSAQHFASAMHARLFTQLVVLITTGKKANPVTLKSFGETDNALQASGGKTYLVQLAKRGMVLDRAGALDYARLISSLATRRALIGLLQSEIDQTSRADHNQSMRVGGLSVPRGALKEICEWARSPPVANSPVPRGSRCRRRE